MCNILAWLVVHMVDFEGRFETQLRMEQKGTLLQNCELRMLCKFNEASEIEL